ncbi:DUF1738 domain-containing protein (plasmid) [Moraxella nonliquefaciens]|uniref:DUF1738 domain-containing protein n=1 Tax=Moraxella nonliquefaciens TaxID=478 RepID=A0A7T3F068_MORNO|nr:DUF1738 domain-containing protein [Moraxella nonliquefaciens]
MSQKYDEHIQVLANKLIEQIKENKAPWQKPWTGAEFSLPVNHQGTPYQGVNSLNLMVEAQSKATPITAGSLTITPKSKADRLSVVKKAR